jgi:hypothetical protein
MMTAAGWQAHSVRGAMSGAEEEARPHHRQREDRMRADLPHPDGQGLTMEQSLEAAVSALKGVNIEALPDKARTHHREQEDRGRPRLSRRR